MGTTGIPKAIEPLIKALDEPQPNVQLNVIWSLAKLWDIRALDPLLLLSRHRDKKVRDESRKAIKKDLRQKVKKAVAAP